MARQLPKRTREAIAACESVGLMFWSGHPGRNCLWAVDDRQQAHTVRIHKDGSAQHVCCQLGEQEQSA